MRTFTFHLHTSTSLTKIVSFALTAPHSWESHGSLKFRRVVCRIAATHRRSARTRQQTQGRQKRTIHPLRLRGTLPANWKKIGLTDTQVQEIYKVQSKHNDEIDKLEAKIKELKTARDKEMKAVLTPEQKKRLDDIVTGKRQVTTRNSRIHTVGPGPPPSSVE